MYININSSQVNYWGTLSLNLVVLAARFSKPGVPMILMCLPVAAKVMARRCCLERANAQLSTPGLGNSAVEMVQVVLLRNPSLEGISEKCSYWGWIRGW